MFARVMETAPDLQVLALAFAVSAGVLMAALGFQYLGGLAPCVLCLYQRYPHVFVLAVAVVAALALSRNRSALPWFLLVSAGAYAVGAFIAGFHVGVEQKWWEGLPSCGGAVTGTMSAQELAAQLFATPVVRCDEVVWSLLGISMAGYNFLISLALFGLCLGAFRACRRNREA